MQEALKKAARWYIKKYDFTVDEMRQDLTIVLNKRKIAFDKGNLQNIYRAFAASEIIKAAICLSTGEEYNTNFSKLELNHIKRLSNPVPEKFICRHCGKEYPVSAFMPDSRYSNNLSRYCLSCEKEINRLRTTQRLFRKATGYIDNSGAIINLAI